MMQCNKSNQYANQFLVLCNQYAINAIALTENLS